LSVSRLESLGWDAAWASELEGLEQSDPIPGRVAAQHRGAYVVWTEDGDVRAEVAGSLYYDRDVGGALPAVGDWVALRRGDGGRATVQGVLRRRTAIARKNAGLDSVDQVLAANVDRVFLLNGVDEDFSLRRLERYLATAWESGADPVVLLTKIDLAVDLESRILEAESVAIGVPVMPVSNVTGQGLDAVAAYVEPGRTSVLLGSSGVGKSSLLNRLAGEELMRTSEVAADGTGRHTTTHRELLLLPGGGLVIDTPGLRELQLFEGDMTAAFPDIEELAAECRFRDCAHQQEPGCAVHAAVDNGVLELDRLRSWRKLQRELASIEARSNKRLHAARKRRWKEISKHARTNARPSR
jgi:ribosome biogenesis GTPase / thiamine phosphate phosphatase